MEWKLRLVGTGIDGQSRSFKVMALSWPDGLGDIASLGLTLVEAKQLLVQVQQEVVAAQARHQAMFRPDCQSCSGRCHVKDWRPRVAADVLQHLLPIDAGRSRETLRSHTQQVGKRLADAAVEKAPAAAAITVSLDSTFIRSCEDGERHLEVRVGNVEAVDGGRQVFGAAARAESRSSSEREQNSICAKKTVRLSSIQAGHHAGT
jgi:hypothetical protein